MESAEALARLYLVEGHDFEGCDGERPVPIAWRSSEFQY